MLDLKSPQPLPQLHASCMRGPAVALWCCLELCIWLCVCVCCVVVLLGIVPSLVRLMAKSNVLKAELTGSHKMENTTNQLCLCLPEAKKCQMCAPELVFVCLSVCGDGVVLFCAAMLVFPRATDWMLGDWMLGITRCHLSGWTRRHCIGVSC